MKDIDPEVAALLDDIPKAKLPKKLIEEGWGRFTVSQMRSAGKAPKVPSPEQAPRYTENCVQCGRPVTNARRGGGWWDHSGGMECDGALVDDQMYMEHVTQSYLDDQERLLRDRQEHMPLDPVPPRVRQKDDKKWKDLLSQTMAQRAKDAARTKARREAPCSATKRQSACDHQCSQRGDHFGFHECKYCRHLWK